MSISVRQAMIHDVERIAPLFDAYRQFYGKPQDVDLARQFLTDRITHQESIIFLVVDENGVVMGFTQLYPSFSSTRVARTYILNDLYVVPAARGVGIAKLLLNEAARFGRNSGAVRLSLSTALTNVPAQKLYESLGWKRDSAFCEYGLTL